MSGTATDLYDVADDLESRGMSALAARVVEAARALRRLEKHGDALVRDSLGAGNVIALAVPVARRVGR